LLNISPIDNQGKDGGFDLGRSLRVDTGGKVQIFERDFFWREVVSLPCTAQNVVLEENV
jgi:hypothetical protein